MKLLYGQGGTKGFEYNFNIKRRDGDAGIVTTARALMRFIVAIDGNPSKADFTNRVLHSVQSGIYAKPQHRKRGSQIESNQVFLWSTSGHSVGLHVS